MPPRFADIASAGGAGRDLAPVALTLLLGAALAFQSLAPLAPVDGGVSAPAPRRSATWAGPAGRVPPLAVVDTAAIADRSIFAPSRNSGAPPAAATDVQLLGVARSGAGGLATLGDRAGATATLRPGETWQGWTLAAVGGGVAVLRRGGSALTLRVGQPLAAAPASSP